MMVSNSADGGTGRDDRSTYRINGLLGLLWYREITALLPGNPCLSYYFVDNSTEYGAKEKAQH